MTQVFFIKLKLNISLIIVTCLKQVRQLEIGVGGAYTRGGKRGVECVVAVVILNPHVAISVKILCERREPEKNYYY